jgi:integrase
VRAALETGCRYSELARLEVYDFNFDPGTVAIRKSKGGKPGHVILTPEGAEFFQHHCAGRTGSDLMFRHADGSRWNTSEQSRPMKEACEHATIMPRVSFHILRHSWASLAVMAGVPLLVVAENLGHADTRMSRNITGIWHRATSLTPSAPGAPRFGDRASRAESQRLWPHSAGKNAPITSDMQDMRLGDRNPL